eukprot:1724786-Pyramimonas_sp.AAC.1
MEIKLQGFTSGVDPMRSYCGFDAVSMRFRCGFDAVSSFRESELQNLLIIIQVQQPNPER